MIVIIIFFILLGLIVLSMSLYMIIRTKQINKIGIKTTAIVKSSEKIEKDLNGKIKQLGYDTTFEVEYNGERYTKLIRTSKEYEIGSSYEGTYVNNGKKDKLYLDEEGVYNRKYSKWASYVVSIRNTFFVSSYFCKTN